MRLIEHKPDQFGDVIIIRGRIAICPICRKSRGEDKRGMWKYVCWSCLEEINRSIFFEKIRELVQPLCIETFLQKTSVSLVIPNWLDDLTRKYYDREKNCT